jgi:hypothetical protein
VGLLTTFTRSRRMSYPAVTLFVERLRTSPELVRVKGAVVSHALECSLLKMAD